MQPRKNDTGMNEILIAILVMGGIAFLLSLALIWSSRKFYVAENPLIDGFVMGVGFTASLVLIGAIREYLGTGMLFGYAITPFKNEFILMSLAPGAVITLGLVLAGINHLQRSDDK